MLAMFLLGFVMDAFEIIFVVVPIVAPALLKMPGVDPVWLGIMMAVNLQTSYMHPPLGPTLFYLRGVAPPEITTRHIYVGIIPFVLIQLFALVVLWFVPGLGDHAAARALRPLKRPEAARQRSRARPRRRQEQRQTDRGRAHVLDALDGACPARVGMRSPSFSIMMLSNSTIRKNERADQRKALAGVCGQEEGERHSDRQHHQLLAERLFRLRRCNEMPFQLLMVARQSRSHIASASTARPTTTRAAFASLFHIVAWACIRPRMKAAEMFSLKGRVALVTGASSAPGTPIHQRLAENGAAVARVARRADRLADLQKSIKSPAARASDQADV